MHIRMGTIEDLKKVYKSYELAFPPNERKPLAHIEQLIISGVYELILAEQITSNVTETIGYALVSKIVATKQLWLDFIAIESHHQSSGYGSRLFNAIIDLYGQDVLGMFIEIEIPDENTPEVFEQQLKRIAFYERLGARKLDMEYLLPSNEGPVPMYLYYFPISMDTSLNRNSIRQTIEIVFGTIHSDVKGSLGYIDLIKICKDCKER